MGEKTDEDIYSLWWEYLEQSDNYRRFCAIYPMVYKKLEEKDKMLDEGNYYVNQVKKLDAHFIGFRKEHLIALAQNWNYFGDVFHKSFDEWWAESRLDKKSEKKDVIDLSDLHAIKKLDYVRELRVRSELLTKNLLVKEYLDSSFPLTRREIILIRRSNAFGQRFCEPQTQVFTRV